jgi:hypothetical protein
MTIYEAFRATQKAHLDGKVSDEYFLFVLLVEQVEQAMFDITYMVAQNQPEVVVDEVEVDDGQIEMEV